MPIISCHFSFQVDVKGDIIVVDSVASLCNSQSSISATSVNVEQIEGITVIRNVTVEETRNPSGLFDSRSVSISNFFVHHGSGVWGGAFLKGKDLLLFPLTMLILYMDFYYITWQKKGFELLF